jgi:hypothetical protein
MRIKKRYLALAHLVLLVLLDVGGQLLLRPNLVKEGS